MNKLFRGLTTPHYHQRFTAAVCAGLCLAVLCGAPARAIAQGAGAQGAGAETTVSFDSNGLKIAGSDGVSKLTLHFRIQELFSATSKGETDFGVRSSTLAIRRMRLKMDGTIRDPRLKTKLELAFSRSDLDLQNSGVANVLLDAYVSWQFNQHFLAYAGQTKLPSNRQRNFSSGELQSPDRSRVNSLFTADRDVGVFGVFTHPVGTAVVKARGAVTGGEGRNQGNGDDGFAYTGRIEFLPFGEFTNNGDYVEGDQEREPSVKLSVAGGVSRNDRARRVGGQVELPLFEARSMTTQYADAILKRAGVMVELEYAHRLSPDPITTSGTSTRYVFAGEGWNAQASWLLPDSHWEPMLRYTSVIPATSIRTTGAERSNEAAVGVARYVNGHRIKVNAEFIHGRFENMATRQMRGAYTLRTGLEFGF